MKLLLVFAFFQLAILTSGQQNMQDLHDAMVDMMRQRMKAHMDAVNFGNGHGQGSLTHPSHRHYNRKTHSKVVMPSGGSYVIAKTKESKHICSKKSDLVTMRPYDKKWKNEYMIVKREIENTNRNPILTFEIVKIQKVFNSCLWRKYRYRRDQIYEEFKTTNERMLFHGSGDARDVALQGFDERYARNGNFGAGLYFADHSSKSHDYTGKTKDETSQMLLCRVTLGKEHREMSPKKFAHAPVGYQSVVGEMADTEYVVYRGEQAYPEYLITYKLGVGWGKFQ